MYSLSQTLACGASVSNPALNLAPFSRWTLRDKAAQRRLALRLEASMDYKQRITIEPGKRGGKPCIRGLRITVYDVLDYLASGMTPAEILAEFDYLSAEDIQACLAYAADREHHQLAVNT